MWKHSNCDPSDCYHDCDHEGGATVMHILQNLVRLEEHYMEKIEKRIQETTFDVKVQYCDPDDCTHDCKREGTNNCDVVITSLW